LTDCADGRGEALIGTRDLRLTLRRSAIEMANDRILYGAIMGNEYLLIRSMQIQVSGGSI
jgi:hypothetical protein